MGHERSEETRAVYYMTRWVFLLLCVGVSFTASAQQWKQYQNTAGEFAVLLPGEPTNTLMQHVGGTESRSVTARHNGVVYMVAYATMAQPHPVNQTMFTAYRNGILHALGKCRRVGKERPASPTVAQYIGGRYKLMCGTPPARMTIVGNFYWGEHHAYAVIVAFSPKAESSAHVSRFLQSFKVLPPRR